MPSIKAIVVGGGKGMHYKDLKEIILTKWTMGVEDWFKREGIKKNLTSDPICLLFCFLGTRRYLLNLGHV